MPGVRITTTGRTVPDYGVYLVTDSSLCGERGVVETVLEAVRGGVTLVQLREKHADTRPFVELACALKAALTPLGVPLLINDRLDVALACGADGVHVGQRDMPCAMVRKLLGPSALIGLSVETEAQVLAAGSEDVDYLGVSPVFGTPTKTDTATPWGLAGVQKVRSLSRFPLVAIGGIDVTNAPAVLAAGADGLAVVSAICGQADPGAAAAALRAVVDIRRTSYAPR